MHELAIVPKATRAVFLEILAKLAFSAGAYRWRAGLTFLVFAFLALAIALAVIAFASAFSDGCHEGSTSGANVPGV